MPVTSFSLVPADGPLILGAVYKRSDLHLRFGGNTNSGIVPSNREPVILLFHTLEKANQFYSDGFDDHGVYHFSGKGAYGDMPWNSENKALRQQASDGRAILFFERFQRTGGHWQLRHKMVCVGHDVRTTPDKNGDPRSGIVFQLIEEDAQDQFVVQNVLDFSLQDLRTRAIDAASGTPRLTTNMTSAIARSAVIREYALRRSGGQCEGCSQPAPFAKPNGEPFLEVHHLLRLADGGIDSPDSVAAICPNCHRRCHHGADGTVYNADLAARVIRIEASLLSDSR
jgi:5-methylcytosine-specific restriction protein A